MGNWSPQLAAERQRQSAAQHEWMAERDRLLPPMDRPCGTPGAVYTIVADGRELSCSVELPFDVNAAIPASALEDLKRALHDTMLPLVETFYRGVWDETLAGKLIDGDDKPLPWSWEGLFFRWLDRCVARGEMPTFDGRKIWNEHGVNNLKRDAEYAARERQRRKASQLASSSREGSNIGAADGGRPNPKASPSPRKKDIP
jgi:hypothetical protein